MRSIQTGWNPKGATILLASVLIAIVAVSSGCAGVITGKTSQAATSTPPPAPAPQSLTITGSILASALNGTTYTSTNHAAGGTLPYTWSVSSGQLPPGLAVTGTTGTISGTPTTNGAYNFTLNVADSSSTKQSTSAAYTVTVGANIFDQY